MNAMRLLSLVMVGTVAGCATPKSGILVMAHGGDDTWNRDVEATVEPLRRHYPVEIAFGMARTSTLRGRTPGAPPLSLRLHLLPRQRRTRLRCPVRGFTPSTLWRLSHQLALRESRSFRPLP